MPSTDPTTARLRRTLLRATVGATAVLAASLGLVACGSGTPTPDAGAPAGSATSRTSTPSSSPTSSPTSSPSTAPAGADCSARAILAALPGGAAMERYDCAETGGTEWAAARAAPGDTVFFLRWEGGRWQAEESSDVCGTASAGLPPALLDYCKTATSPPARPTRTPSPRPTAPSTPVRPAVAECTSKAILAALPEGARMQRFSCAEVGGTEWAAARVTPGDTTFFLQWTSGRWQAEQASDVCGAASAGLPAPLEHYCG